MSREDIGEGGGSSSSVAAVGVHTPATETAAAREPRGVRLYRSSNHFAVRRPNKKFSNPYFNFHFSSTARNDLSGDFSTVSPPFSPSSELSNFGDQSCFHPHGYRLYQQPCYTQKESQNNSTRNPSYQHDLIQTTSSFTSCLNSFCSSSSSSCRHSSSPRRFSSFSASAYSFHLKQNASDDVEMPLCPSSHAEYHSRQDRYTLYSLASSSYSVPPFTHSDLIATQTYKGCEEKAAAVESSNLKIMGEETAEEEFVASSSSVDSVEEDGDDVTARVRSVSGVTTLRNDYSPERIRRTSMLSSSSRRSSVHHHHQPHHYHNYELHHPPPHHSQPYGQKRLDCQSSKATTSVVVTYPPILVKENDENISQFFSNPSTSPFLSSSFFSGGVSSTPLISRTNKSSIRHRRPSLKEKLPSNLLQGCSSESLTSLSSSVENQNPPLYRRSNEILVNSMTTAASAATAAAPSTISSSSSQSSFYHLSSSSKPQFSSGSPLSPFVSFNSSLDSDEGGGGIGENVELILVIARNLLRLYYQQRTRGFHRDPYILLSLQKLQSYILYNDSTAAVFEDPVCIQQIRELIGALELAFMDSLQIDRQLEEQEVEERVIRRRSSLQTSETSDAATQLKASKGGGGINNNNGKVNNTEGRRLSLRRFRSYITKVFETVSNYFRRKQINRNSEMFDDPKQSSDTSTSGGFPAIINNQNNNIIENEDILESSSLPCFSTQVSSVSSTAKWIAIT